MVLATDSPAVLHPGRRHPFAGRSRWLAAILVTAGGVLQVIEFALVRRGLSAPERIEWWVANPSRVELSQAAGILAIPFLIGGFLVMARLCFWQSRRITVLATSLLCAAMVGLAGIQGLEMSANWLAQAGDTEAAVLVMESATPGIPGISLLVMFLLGALGGMVLLNVALWRSSYVPRVVVFFTVGFVVLDFFVSMSLLGHLSVLAADLILGWAIVTGFRRMPREARTSRAD